MIEVVLSGMGSETTSPTQVPPLLQPSNLHGTSPQFSTYTSRGLWNDCSGHLLQSQPLLLSIACPEESCHLQPWVLHPPLERKIHSAWRGQTPVALVLWLPLHRHLWVRLCQNTPPTSSRSLTLPTYSIKNSRCSQHLPQYTVSIPTQGQSNWPA